MRKNIIRTLIAVMLLSCVLTVPAFAESATVTGSEVNMRSGPGLSYEVIDCLPRGAEVTVLNRSNSNWYAVSYNGSEGFMSSGYLSIYEQSADVHVEEASGTGYINAMYVRFRSGPSTDSTILGEYNTGREVSITGTSGDWTACVINGQSGYIFSRYISSSSGSYEDSYDGGHQGEVHIDGSYDGSYEDSFQGSHQDSSSGSDIQVQEPEASPEPSPEASPRPSDPDAGVEVPVKPEESPEPSPEASPEPSDPGAGEEVPVKPEESPVPSPEASPEPSPETEITPCDPAAGYITGDYVRFRSGPSTSHSIIDSYNAGQEITITGTCGDWTACTIEGKDGFVYSRYVRRDEESSRPGDDSSSHEGGEDVPGTSEPGYITGNNVRLRSRPGTDSEILDELFYGNSVTITGTQGDWTSVIYKDQKGYVFSQYVKKGEYSHQSSGGTELGREIADYALRFVGYNYTWGGCSPDTGFDCSGLTYYVYSQFGYTLNRVACDQARNGVHVDPEDMQPGDIICFYSGGDYIGHVGMYIGNNMFVHAANSRTGVVTAELSGYYESRGYEVRRII